MAIDTTKVETLVKRNEKIMGKELAWMSLFQELAEWHLPRKSYITRTKSPGEKVDYTKLYDSTGIRAPKTMAAGFMSSLTNPATKWFNLRTRDLELMKDKDAQMWFKDVEDIVFSALASSNFNNTIQEFYLNAGVFGTSAVMVLEDTQDKVRFIEIPINQIYMEEDAGGRVTKFYRNFPLTAQQAFDIWGDDAGEAVKKAMKGNTPELVLRFLHYVAPRDERDPSKRDNTNMPYQSLYIELSKKHLIKEGGFQTNPYAVGRFYKDANEVYGYSPAMDVMPDTKLINAMVKTMLRSAMKQVDPPLVAPRRGFIAPLNGNPGKINYRDEKTPGDAITQFPVGSNASLTLEMLQDTRSNIEKAFFVPLFQAISNLTKQMTIPEVQRRVAENMVLLGPVVGRFTQEMLDPIILRVFDILFAAGEIPEPPQSVQGADFDIVYISALAKAQRESKIFDIQAFMNDVGTVGTIIPSVVDKINGDEIIDDIAKARGIPPDIIRSEQEVEDIRRAQAEAAAQAQQIELAQKGAEISATGAKAEKDVSDAERE